MSVFFLWQTIIRYALLDHKHWKLVLSNWFQWFRWKDSALLTPFEFNDAVEVQTFDPINCRLALASHSGQIKMFDVDGSCKLTATWKASINDAIPSGLIFFGGANQNLLIHGTETGQMWVKFLTRLSTSQIRFFRVCRNAQNSTVLWTKTLAGGMLVLYNVVPVIFVFNTTLCSVEMQCFHLTKQNSSWTTSRPEHLTSIASRPIPHQGLSH